MTEHPYPWLVESIERMIADLEAKGVKVEQVIPADWRDADLKTLIEYASWTEHVCRRNREKEAGAPPPRP